MPSTRISKDFDSGIYFITLTVRNWYYVLDRYSRWEILSNTLYWFQKNKNLKIYAFVFMVNHIHLIIKSNNAIGFVRDFKKFTTKMILNNIKQSEPNVVKIFQKENKKFQFWSNNNMPELIETERFFQQKINYIHNNPVKRCYVLNPDCWYWSSANNLCQLKINDIYEE